MADKQQLETAKKRKADEFYTRYEDIEKEVTAYVEHDPDIFKDKIILLPCDDPERSNFTKYFSDNFERFGLQMLISTCYVEGGRGRVYIKTRSNGSATELLDGDGDFQSEEITKLRDMADVIITNPPFSLFKKFLPWITEADKDFLIVGNMNAITYKDAAPLLKADKMWLGHSLHSGDVMFDVPDDYPLEAATCGVSPDGVKFIRVQGVRWYTNMDHGQEPRPLHLKTMEENLASNKKLIKKLEENYGRLEYPHYDNYDAIEVPITECIPSDYDGIMGVPISFMDKYDPRRFEIVDFWNSGFKKAAACKITKSGKQGTWNGPTVDGRALYYRILIKNKTS